MTIRNEETAICKDFLCSRWSRAGVRNRAASIVARGSGGPEDPLCSTHRALQPGRGLCLRGHPFLTHQMCYRTDMALFRKDSEVKEYTRLRKSLRIWWTVKMIKLYTETQPYIKAGKPTAGKWKASIQLTLDQGKPGRRKSGHSSYPILSSLSSPVPPPPLPLPIESVSQLCTILRRSQVIWLISVQANKGEF